MIQDWSELNWMVNGERWRKGLSLVSKIIRDDEDELESDDLYSEFKFTDNLRSIDYNQPWSNWGDVEKNNMGIKGNDMRIKSVIHIFGRNNW